jgi:hypothetical protein
MGRVMRKDLLELMRLAVLISFLLDKAIEQLLLEFLFILMRMVRDIWRTGDHLVISILISSLLLLLTLSVLIANIVILYWNHTRIARKIISDL